MVPINKTDPIRMQSRPAPREYTQAREKVPTLELLSSAKIVPYTEETSADTMRVVNLGKPQGYSPQRADAVEVEQQKEA
jgi:hypothetical protein